MQFPTSIRRTTVAARGRRAARRALVGAALVGAAVVTAATPALAVTSVDGLIADCGDRAVCQFDGATISNADELQNTLPNGVRVYVIPQPDQAESVQSTSLAAQLRNATDADTVIVIEDRQTDRFAVSSSDDATAITEALYSQGEADGGVAVAAIEGQLQPAADPAPAQPADDGVGIADFGVMLVVIAAVIVVGGGVAIAVGRNRKRKRGAGGLGGSKRVARELAQALSGEDGEYVEHAIAQLFERAERFPDVGDRISALAKHVSDLFVRVRKRGNEQSLRLLLVEYRDTLSKLLKALSDDYYGDILANPQYWSGPAARLEEVGRAVDSVDQQAVENIKQVNESRDIEFQVALDSLIKTVDEAKLSDVYSDRHDQTGRGGARRNPGGTNPLHERPDREQ